MPWFVLTSCRKYSLLIGVRHMQSDTMDALDEKANGGPSMEVEEIVSVNDRM